MVSNQAAAMAPAGSPKSVSVTARRMAFIPPVASPNVKKHGASGVQVPSAPVPSVPPPFVITWITETPVNSPPVISELEPVGLVLNVFTDFVIEVNPRHELFYKRMLGFNRIGEERMCPRVGAPAILRHLSLDYIDRKITELGGILPPPPGEKSLYPYGFSKEDEMGIAQRIQGG